MKKKIFSASLAKATFALACVLTLSLAFTACDSKRNLPEPNQEEPDPKPDPKPDDPNLLTLEKAVKINGEMREVKRAVVVTDGLDNSYDIRLIFKDGDKWDYLMIDFDPNENGKTFDLKNSITGRGVKWGVQYIIDSKGTFYAHNYPNKVKFSSGEMKYNIDPITGEGSVEITNASITHEGTKYTFETKWKGKAEVDHHSAVVIKTNKKIGQTISFGTDVEDVYVLGATKVKEPYYKYDQYNFEYEIKSQTIVISGKISMLDIKKEGITSIDLSRLSGIKELYISENPLTKLDVSKNTKLTLLACNKCGLNALDVTKNTLLGDLQCAENELKTLDISNNTNLYNLDCADNYLTSLDMSSSNNWTYVWCYGNKLTYENVKLGGKAKGLTYDVNFAFHFKGENSQTLTKQQVQELKSKGWQARSAYIGSDGYRTFDDYEGE